MVRLLAAQNDCMEHMDSQTMIADAVLALTNRNDARRDDMETFDENVDLGFPDRCLSAFCCEGDEGEILYASIWLNCIITRRPDASTGAQ